MFRKCSAISLAAISALNSGLLAETVTRGGTPGMPGTSGTSPGQSGSNGEAGESLNDSVVSTDDAEKSLTLNGGNGGTGGGGVATPRTAAEIEVMSGKMDNSLFIDLVQLLGRMPRIILLILKTNDLSELQSRFRSVASYFIVHPIYVGFF